MQIHWFKAQAPRRVLALAKHLDIDCEFIEVDMMDGGLSTPGYRQLNPNRKAPTLVDGDLVLWESSAIMAHLCIAAGSDMWPAHAPAEQVEVLRWLSWNDSHWAPAVAPFYFEHVIKPGFGIGPPDLAMLQLKETRQALATFGKVLDAHLDGRTHVACGRLTIADLQLASMATDWRVSHMPFEGFPNIVRWLDGLMALPAWADPWPRAASAAATG